MTPEEKAKELVEFFPIPGMGECFEISKCGVVRSKKRMTIRLGKLYPVPGKILSQYISDTGYRVLRVKCNVLKINKIFYLHRLLAATFIPNQYNKPCINHKDGNKLNNNLDNLEWCNKSENALHAYRVIKSNHVRGQGSSNAKFTNNEISDIRKMWHNGISCKELGIMYGVHGATISRITTGKTYVESNKTELL